MSTLSTECASTVHCSLRDIGSLVYIETHYQPRSSMGRTFRKGSLAMVQEEPRPNINITYVHLSPTTQILSAIPGMCCYWWSPWRGVFNGADEKGAR